MSRVKTFKIAAASAFAALTLGVMSNGAPAVDREVSLAVADGNSVFGAKCALCHGKDGHGLPSWRAKGQPDFTEAQWQSGRTDAQIVETIKNGKGKNMPSFRGKLSDEEVNAVVGKVRSFGKKK